jgi:hypothetical protein
MHHLVHAGPAATRLGIEEPVTGSMWPAIKSIGVAMPLPHRRDATEFSATHHVSHVLVGGIHSHLERLHEPHTSRLHSLTGTREARLVDSERLLAKYVQPRFACRFDVFDVPTMFGGDGDRIHTGAGEGCIEITLERDPQTSGSGGATSGVAVPCHDEPGQWIATGPAVARAGEAEGFAVRVTVWDAESGAVDTVQRKALPTIPAGTAVRPLFGASPKEPGQGLLAQSRTLVLPPAELLPVKK